MSTMKEHNEVQCFSLLRYEEWNYPVADSERARGVPITVHIVSLQTILILAKA